MAISNFAQKVTQAPSGASSLIMSNVVGVAFGDSAGTATYTKAIPAGLYQFDVKVANSVSNTYSFKDSYGSVVYSGSVTGSTTKMIYLPDNVASYSVEYSATSWTTRTATAGLVTYNDGYFVTPFYTSTNGVNWTTITTGILKGTGAVYGGGVFVVGGDSVYARSTNGITWTTGALSINQNYWTVYGNGKFVMGGQGSGVIYSTTGDSWTAVNLSMSFAVGKFLNNLFLISGGSGSSTLYTSTDAITWTSRGTPLNSATLRDFAYGAGVYIAVGDAGSLSTSTDAITWTTRTSGFGGESITAAVYTGKMFVAGGGSGTVKTSTDGINWAASTSTSGAMTSLATNGNLLVATSSNSTKSANLRQAQSSQLYPVALT